MRETKFRGKSVKTGEWLSGYLFPRGLLNDPDYLSPLWIASGFENECMAVDEKTVGQCTDLRDRNGKEIYEGDIVVMPGEYPYFDKGKPNYTATVEWVFSGFQAVLHCINKDKAGISDGMNEGYLEESGDFEVIGNINENPELLKW